jgi:predicted transposase YdaD
VEHKHLDVSTKELIWEGPAAWVERFGIGPPGPVSVIDSEISTMTASADKVLKVDGPIPYLLNLEPQSYHDIKLPRTLWYRQVALDYKHELPVLTVLILLRKEANSPGLTGSYERHLPDGSLANRYNYRVVRLWQEDPDLYLTGGVNLVPLAPLTNVSEADLPALVRRMDERISPEPEPRADWLWLAAYVLMGWRYDVKQAAQWLKGVWNMDKSPSYQAILREGRDEGWIEGRNEGLIEGRVAEAQRLLLMLGGNRFGEPDEATRGALEAIHDVDRLERMTVRVYHQDIADWEGLLNTA